MRFLSIIFFASVIYAKTCLVTFIVKQSIPTYPHIFYKEKFVCHTLSEGLTFQKRLGCRKRSVWYKGVRYYLYICPFNVMLVSK